MDDPEIDGQGVAQIQAEVRHMLAEVARVSQEGGFRFYAAYGTLLGAVRDQRLIPWDDDADVWVPTKHYREYCAYLKEHLPSTLQVLEPQDDPGYEYLFARVSPRGVDHKLIHIDLFPLAGAPSTRRAQRVYTLAIRSLVLMFLMKRARLEELRHYSRRKRLVARLAKLVLVPVGDGLVLAAYQRLVDHFESSTVATLTNSCGAYKERDFFDARWFSETSRVQVSGVDLPAPRDHDALLTSIYGDYLKPIDEEAQRAQMVHATRYYVKPLKEQGWPSEGGLRSMEESPAS